MHQHPRTPQVPSSSSSRPTPSNRTISSRNEASRSSPRAESERVGGLDDPGDGSQAAQHAQQSSGPGREAKAKLNQIIQVSSILPHSIIYIGGWLSDQRCLSRTTSSKLP